MPATTADSALATNNAPLAPAKPRENRITAKVRAAIDAMVWEGLPRAAAAEKAGISEHGLYKALRKPPVKAAYLRELEVLRTSERARNFHALVEVRDQTTNHMARVNAVREMEQTDEFADRKAVARTPGVVIQIVTQSEPKALKTLDIRPEREVNEQTLKLPAGHDASTED